VSIFLTFFWLVGDAVGIVQLDLGIKSSKSLITEVCGVWFGDRLVGFFEANVVCYSRFFVLWPML
jgi:hypothetical protein